MEETFTPEGITFTFLLTAAGAGIAATLVTGTVALLKAVIAPRTINGALAAFLLSGVLFVLAGIAVSVDSLDEGLVVFAAWLTTATAAVGVHSALHNLRGG